MNTNLILNATITCRWICLIRWDNIWSLLILFIKIFIVKEIFNFSTIMNENMKVNRKLHIKYFILSEKKMIFFLSIFPNWRSNKIRCTSKVILLVLFNPMRVEKYNAEMAPYEYIHRLSFCYERDLSKMHTIVGNKKMT